jgi:hypothetical protein
MRTLFALAASLTVVGFAIIPSPAQQSGGWTTLFDGSNLNSFNMLGKANWKIADGSVQADSGNGFLITKASYKDFEITAEFWVDEKANSGVFIRCSDPTKVDAENAYEVNIFDTRPDPKYATGAIVNVASPSTAIKAGGKWNTYVIKAQGPHMTVVLNGTQTVDVQHGGHAEGRIALQYGAGVVKFRSVKIRSL